MEYRQLFLDEISLDGKIPYKLYSTILENPNDIILFGSVLDEKIISFVILKDNFINAGTMQLLYIFTHEDFREKGESKKLFASLPDFLLKNKKRYVVCKFDENFSGLEETFSIMSNWGFYPIDVTTVRKLYYFEQIDADHIINITDKFPSEIFTVSTIENRYDLVLKEFSDKLRNTPYGFDIEGYDTSLSQFGFRDKNIDSAIIVKKNGHGKISISSIYIGKYAKAHGFFIILFGKLLEKIKSTYGNNVMLEIELHDLDLAVKIDEIFGEAETEAYGQEWILPANNN